MSDHMVSNAGLGEAAERAVASGRVTWKMLEACLPNGSCGRAGSSRVQRMLGVKPHYVSGGKQSYQTQITEDNAIALCNALGLLPREVDI